MFVVVNLSSPTARFGTKMTANANTQADALCAITITDPLDRHVPGLFTKVAEAAGLASWSWTVSNRSVGGIYRVVVECVQGEDRANGSATFRVYDAA